MNGLSGFSVDRQLTFARGVRTRPGSTGSAGACACAKKNQRSATQARHLASHRQQPEARRPPWRARSGGQQHAAARSRSTMKPSRTRFSAASVRAVEELAGIERAGRHAHRLLHQLRRADAGGRLQGRLVLQMPALRRSAAMRMAQPTQRDARAPPAPTTRSNAASPASEPRSARRAGRPRRARSAEVHERQRMRPFLDEAQAGVDHRGAVPQQRPQAASAASGSTTATSRCGWPMRRATTTARPAPMNAGSTMTSRESHEVRHISTARQARSGRPRCRNEAARPTTSITAATTSSAAAKARRQRDAAEHRQRRARRRAPAPRRRWW